MLKLIGADVSTDALHVAFSNMEEFELLTKARISEKNLIYFLKIEEKKNLI